MMLPLVISEKLWGQGELVSGYSALYVIILYKVRVGGRVEDIMVHIDL